MKTLHFKNKEAYRKWLSYEHIRTPTGKIVKAKKGRISIAQTSKVHPKIIIGTYAHKVKHSLY